MPQRAYRHQDIAPRPRVDQRCIRLVLFCSLAAFLFSERASAQVTFGAVTSSTCSNCTTLTFSHTVGGGSNGAIAVGVSYFHATITVSSITYAGVNLTFGCRAQSPSTDKSEIWYLAAPATGANNVVVTMGGQVQALVGGATSYTGVDQTTPTGTCVTAGGSSTAPSVNASSATNDMVVDNLSWDQSVAATATVGAGQTSRYNTATGGQGGSGSTEPGAATVTMSWTLSSSANWAIAALPWKQVSGGGGAPPHQLTTLGCCGIALVIDDTNLAGFAECGPQDPDCSQGISVCTTGRDSSSQCVDLTPDSAPLRFKIWKQTPAQRLLSPVASLSAVLPGKGVTLVTRTGPPLP